MLDIVPSLFSHPSPTFSCSSIPFMMALFSSLLFSSLLFSTLHPSLSQSWGHSWLSLKVGWSTDIRESVFLISHCSSQETYMCEGMGVRLLRLLGKAFLLPRCFTIVWAHFPKNCCSTSRNPKAILSKLQKSLVKLNTVPKNHVLSCQNLTEPTVKTMFYKGLQKI